MSMVVLNLDQPTLIVPLVRLIDRTADFFAERGAGLQLIIGDTGSSDPEVLARYESLPACTELGSDLKFHYSRSNNDAADGTVRHHRVLFLNNDVVFESPEQIWDWDQASLPAVRATASLLPMLVRSCISRTRPDTRTVRPRLTMYDLGLSARRK